MPGKACVGVGTGVGTGTGFDMMACVCGWRGPFTEFYDHIQQRMAEPVAGPARMAPVDLWALDQAVREALADYPECCGLARRAPDRGLDWAEFMVLPLRLQITRRYHELMRQHERYPAD